MTNGQTDGRTDGRTNNPEAICPSNFFEVGGIKSTGDLKQAGGSTKFGSLSFWPLNMLIFSALSLKFAAISGDKNFKCQGYGFGLNAFMTGAFGAVKITVNLIFFRCLTFFYFIRNLLIS